MPNLNLKSLEAFSVNALFSPLARMPGNADTKNPMATKSNTGFPSMSKFGQKIARVAPYRIWNGPRPRNATTGPSMMTSDRPGLSGDSNSNNSIQLSQLPPRQPNQLTSSNSTSRDTQQRPGVSNLTRNRQQPAHVHTDDQGTESRTESINLGITPESVARRPFNQIQLVIDDNIVTRRIHIGNTMKIFIMVASGGRSTRTVQTNGQHRS